MYQKYSEGMFIFVEKCDRSDENCCSHRFELIPQIPQLHCRLP